MPVRPIRRALLSVSDKTGLVALAHGLAKAGVELLSTGGTARALREAGLAVSDVSAITGFPEILDGRVKTLHPAIHGGLLARAEDAAHEAALREHGIDRIDLLVVNLYPFEEALARGLSGAALIEEIDVGGPAMLRAAAKNHAAVAVVTESGEYPLVLAALAEHGGTTLDLRQRLAAKVFARTAAYDAAIARALAPTGDEPFGPFFAVGGTLCQRLRYGENPHQRAALYAALPASGLAALQQVQGKELSYNNLLDADAAMLLAAEFPEPAVVIVKHNNPCGCAVGATLAAAWQRALACDPISAFGGIVAVNRPIDAELAEELDKLFLEVVIAPAIDDGASAILARKRNLRILTGSAPRPSERDRLAVRSVSGGLLVQDGDDASVGDAELRTASRRAPTDAERSDLLFAWRVAKHVKSNAIVLARDQATVGIGAGQMSRLDSVHIAARKAGQGPGARPCVAASDAFFPFADGVEAVIAVGATAIIQPGGSVRDEEVVAAADAAGVAMLFSGMRHFRH